MARTKPKPPPGPDRDAWAYQTSVINSFYVELDKLSKKAPASPLSDLATQRVNRAIRDAKALMGAWDPYMADLAEFVPAGVNPEVRDALLVVAEIRSGLERLRSSFKLGDRVYS